MDNLTAPERGTWVSAGGKLRIEYSHRVLEDIRAAAVEGFCRFPRGGVEIGGVLLGCVRDGVVHVVSARPVECSYAAGPSFTLTESDETSFRKAMPTGGGDFRAVGWYHSHTRSDLGFPADDAAVHQRLFPESWQVALVVRPEPFGSAEAAFFTRGDDGVMEPVPHGTFLLRPAARLKTCGAVTRPPGRTEGGKDAGAAAAVQILEVDNTREPIAESEVTELPTTVGERTALDPAAPRAPAATGYGDAPERKGSRIGARRFAWAVVTAVAVLAIATWATLYSRHAPAVPPHLALRVAEADGQLQITWDRNSAPLKRARGGAVSIRDGGQNITVPFDAERLRAGGLTYARTSRDIEVRLRVEGPIPAEESVRLFGPAVPRPALSEPFAAPAPKVVEPQPRPEEQPLRRPPTAVNVAAANTQAPASAGRIPTEEPDREASRLRPFRPATLADRAQTGVVLLQPPPVQPAPSLTRDGINLGVPAAGPPPRQRTSEVFENRVPAVPAAGRLIWVGRLERGGRLSIDGQRASSGSLTGELPGVPVRISAYPAELGDGELRVFAASPGLRGNRETAGPQNGWNPMIYAWDARRASDVLVTEVPSSENRWRGISVRGNGRTVSVIVIDWRAAQP